LNPTNPFHSLLTEAEAELNGIIKSNEDELKAILKSKKVNIRLRKRNVRKSVTSIDGLAPDLDFKKIKKAMVKIFSCGGAIVNDKVYGNVIQLNGDHRHEAAEFLVKYCILDKNSYIIHGY